ncbi:MBOAT-domain-containing protein [Suhomyces tanzawaensis NRRL Y-17324]|uniref:O-acyltransferase n=1 Tax=Suhomyces tanzawaensis NRRL Y-17324 TaxID=984487 RepID=A0A1E4SL86_9ASCO|nr:MBOAT-domain-containing protein [Suhomyces tanzawaensis NRRL Y-17324]ODV80192.1 MBOAT-domain-containing protein [Suhomyces tanzawaensis NRRL Y-17324]
MPRRTNTEDKLNILQDRNDGKRRSLIISDEFDDSTSSASISDSDTLHLDDKHAAIVLESTSQSQITRAFHDLNRAASYRLRKRKPKKDVAVDEAPDNNHKSAKDKFVSRFGDIKFYAVSSTIFDTVQFKESDVYGVYVLFWLGIGFFIFSSLVHYYLENKQSKVIWEWPIVQILRKDIVKVAFTDLAMYLSTYFVYLLQKVIKLGWFTWHSTGWIVQSVYCGAFFVFWLYFASTNWMDFPWIAKVFLVLHSLVFVMKMHSYGFYNGYLWKINLELLYSTSYHTRLSNGKAKLPEGFDEEKTLHLLKESIAFCKFELDSQAYTTTISEEGVEYKPKKVVEFPQNITLFNFFEFSMFPTVVYTLNFPRTPRIRWFYVFEKVCGIFGILFLMITVAQKWMYPLVHECYAARNLQGSEKFLKYVLISLDIIPAFLLEYLLTFFMIWDVILNSIAELTRFSDRDFYGPWWSCTDWSEFSRIWNVPVYKFLLRHVYHSSISALHLHRGLAAVVTFMISSIVHELVMYVIFGNFRGYLLFLQMSQVPMIMLARTKLLRNRKILGNVICWFGFITAPSVICTSYLMY